MSEQALKLYNYHVWANKRLFQHLRGLPEELCTTPVQSTFPTLRDGLIHLYQVDTVWLYAMSGSTYEEVGARVGKLREEVQGKSLDGLEALYSELMSQYAAFIEQHDMEEARSYPHPKFGTLKASYQDILQHVVQHGTYHCGNISSMLRQLGHSGTPTDYVLYLYECER